METCVCWMEQEVAAEQLSVFVIISKEVCTVVTPEFVRLKP